MANANTLSITGKSLWLPTALGRQKALETGAAGESRRIGNARGTCVLTLLVVGLDCHTHGEGEEERKDSGETHCGR